MKWLFLLLLVVNLGAFVWGYQNELKTDEAVAPEIISVGNLRLFSEQHLQAGDAIKPSPKPVATPTLSPTATPPPQVTREPARERPPLSDSVKPAPTPVPATAGGCYRLGPIDLNSRARAVADRLAPLRIAASIHEDLAQEKTGYWVVISEAKSLEQAQEIVMKLRASGITDAWRFRSGKMRNAVSLGLFSQRSNAMKVKQRVEAKGFSPEIRPRFTDKPQYWLDFRSAEDPPIPGEMLRQLSADHPRMKLIVRSCP